MKVWICRGCGTTERRREARGLCTTCYSRWYARQHGVQQKCIAPRPCSKCGAETISHTGLCKRCYMKQYRKDNRARLYTRKCELRDVDRFGGRREEIAKRADGRCERCGLTDSEHRLLHRTRLVIHHIDGNGLSSTHPNHSIDNLMLLCQRCHRLIHHEMKMGVAV